MKKILIIGRTGAEEDYFIFDYSNLNIPIDLSLYIEGRYKILFKIEMKKKLDISKIII